MGPLNGVIVLDLGQYLAGPYGAMMLGDLGAEVIKVEPVRGDAMRMGGMPFLGCQRGKLDLAVDVKAPEGLEVVLRLAELADVVHHNMTKGTAARLGVAYEDLKARNPGLVHCNTYAYGAEGPLSDFGGLDPLYQATCGIEYEAGPVAEGNPPLYLRFGMTDTANAMMSAVGVLAALYHQRRTGEGQDLWTSLLNGAAVFASDVFLVWPRPSGPGSQPDGCVPVLPVVRDPGGMAAGCGVRSWSMVTALPRGRAPAVGTLRHGGGPHRRAF
jgi:crotonobetainyl-CoA:carnitine CoA-transferase CaiB-like acyl-CoA transferase